MDLVLVGLLLPGVDNLSLRALEHAATASGYETALVPFGGFAGMEATIRRVLSLRPRVCGVSIQSSESLVAALTLTRLLRDRGYAGRIVCGGHVATLDAAEIIESPAGVDFVVRLAGEHALVALLGDPAEDELAAIPGLVWRGLDGRARLGAPAAPVSPVPRLAPTDRAISETLGIPCADLVASRGCEAHCGYCCVAETSDLARAEGRRGGMAVDRHERRALADLADEIADLHRERGVRVVSFMDDNVLPLEPALAAGLARDLRRALDRRGVARIACTLQVRADAVTDESADALLGLGLARAYVGIDAYTDEGLRAIGRASPAAAGARALATFRAREIPAIANALVLGPTTKLEVLEREAAAIAEVRGGPIHLLPIEARSGTAITRRAEKLGLVEGGFLHRTYRFADPRVAHVGRLLFELPSRLRERSVPVAMYDLGEALGVAARLRPDLDVSQVWSTWDRVTATWNQDQAQTILRAAAAARTSAEAVDALLRIERVRVRALDRALFLELDGASRYLERAASARRGAAAPSRNRSVVMAAVAGAMSIGGCTGVDQPLDASTPDAPTVDTTDPASDAGLLDGGSCVDPDRWPNRSVTVAAGGQHECGPCDPGYDVEADIDADGQVTAFRVHEVDGGLGPLPDDVRACLMRLFDGQCYPSAAGGTVVFSPHCWIA